MSIKDRVQSGIGDEGWTIHTDGSLRYRGRVVVPQLIDLREEILREFHCSRSAVHPGGTKMYQDLRSLVLLKRDEETRRGLYSMMSHVSAG